MTDYICLAASVLSDDMFDLHALYYSLSYCSRRAQILRALGVSKMTSRYYIWNSIKILFFSLCVCLFSVE